MLQISSLERTHLSQHELLDRLRTLESRLEISHGGSSALSPFNQAEVLTRLQQLEQRADLTEQQTKQLRYTAEEVSRQQAWRLKVHIQCLMWQTAATGRWSQQSPTVVFRPGSHHLTAAAAATFLRHVCALAAVGTLLRPVDGLYATSASAHVRPYMYRLVHGHAGA